MRVTIEKKTDQLEAWKPVVGYESAYEVSNLGRVRSVDRVTDRGRRWKGRVLRQATMPNGYRIVTLWRGGAQTSALVHRLVLMAFVGPGPSGTEVLHGDGDPANNGIQNLSWGTRAQNIADQVLHGTHANAAKRFCPAGHEFTEANTYHFPGRPHRACRTCRRAHKQTWKANQKAVAR
jgi:hypothetical protein